MGNTGLFSRRFAWLLLSVVMSSQAAWASMSATITTPTSGWVAQDLATVATVVNSTYQVVSVVVRLGSLSQPATFGDGNWVARFDISSLPAGSAFVTVLATDVMGNTVSATVTIVIDRPPRIEVLNSRLQVARPTASLHGRCVDDLGPCQLTVAIYGGVWSPHRGWSVVVAERTAQGELELSQELCGFENQLLEVEWTALDDRGQRTTVKGKILVELSPNLRVIRTFPGQLLDFDGTRTLEQRDTGVFTLGVLGSATTVDLGTAPPALPATTQAGWLTSTGAVWRDADFHFWADGGTRSVPFDSTAEAVHAETMVGQAGIRVAQLSTGETAVPERGELAVSADGRFLIATGESVRLRTLDGGAQVIWSAADGRERSASPFIEADRTAFLFSPDLGDSWELRLAWDGGSAHFDRVDRKPYRWRGDWVAFSRREGNTTALFLGHCDGGAQRLTFWEGNSEVDVLGPNGAVAYWHEGTKHLMTPGQSSLPLSNQWGQPVAVGDDWYVLEGNTLFAFQPDAGAPTCQAPLDAGEGEGEVADGGTTPSTPRGCGCDGGASANVLLLASLLLARVRHARRR